MGRREIWAGVVLSAALTLWAQAPEGSLGSKEECKTLCDEVMAALAGSAIREAFQKVGPHWAFGPGELSEFQIKTTQQMTAATPRYGKPIGYEFIRQAAVGESLVRLTYLQKFERYLCRWTFTFYKPRDRWLLTDFKWDSQTQALFD